MFGLAQRIRRWREQRALRQHAIPDALWHLTLQRYPFLPRTGAPAHRLRELATLMLASKEFTGAGGLQVSDEMAVCVVAQAALPVLDLGLDWYDDFVGIVLHPHEVVAHREHVDENGVLHRYDEVLAGEAMDGGPVMLNWHDVRRSAQTAGEGYNVVIHEFVHKIDMRDGQADGCPPLPGTAARRAWMAVMEPAFERFREQAEGARRFGGLMDAPWLDDYGAQSIDEFFAVTAEAYFVAPQEFRPRFGELARLYDGFFRRDTTADPGG